MPEEINPGDIIRVGKGLSRYEVYAKAPAGIYFGPPGVLRRSDYALFARFQEIQIQKVNP